MAADSMPPEGVEKLLLPVVVKFGSTCEILLAVAVWIVGPLPPPVPQAAPVVTKSPPVDAWTQLPFVRPESVTDVKAAVLGVVPPIAPGEGSELVDPPSETEVPPIVMAELAKPALVNVPVNPS